MCIFIFFFKQKTAYEMRISDWSSDVCSSDLHHLENGSRDQLPELDPGQRLPSREPHGADCEGRRQYVGDHRGDDRLPLAQAGICQKLSAEPREDRGEQQQPDRGSEGVARQLPARGHRHLPHRLTARPCRGARRSEEHTSELQSLMRISYAVFCLKKKNKKQPVNT